MATKKKKNGKKKKDVQVNKKPRTPRLPGMEDAGIRELEKLAEQYADVRDQRMTLTKRESQMNADLLALMKKHDKTEYHHDEIHCWVKAKDERVKVKLGEIEDSRASAADDADNAEVEEEEMEAAMEEATVEG